MATTRTCVGCAESSTRPESVNASIEKQEPFLSLINESCTGNEGICAVRTLQDPALYRTH
jgi:hypothetical protein